MVHYTQYGIIEGIRRKDKDVLKYVYRQYFPMVRYFIIRNHGSEEDAEDIFQEAIVAVCEGLRKKNLTLDCAFKTYFYSVVRHMWLQYLDRNKINYEFSDMDEFLLLEDKEIYDDFQAKKAIYQNVFGDGVLRYSLPNNSAATSVCSLSYRPGAFAQVVKLDQEVNGVLLVVERLTRGRQVSRQGPSRAADRGPARPAPPDPHRHVA
ncbi:MAG: sigma-70 family RNA polymerase sigma factor [Bacteroidales bacterium]|nr:sigma-70 family RNA polymerase sigma factor [Bacteroidales bacterium]